MICDQLNAAPGATTTTKWLLSSDVGVAGLISGQPWTMAGLRNRFDGGARLKSRCASTAKSSNRAGRRKVESHQNELASASLCWSRTPISPASQLREHWRPSWRTLCRPARRDHAMPVPGGMLSSHPLSSRTTKSTANLKRPSALQRSTCGWRSPHDHEQPTGRRTHRPERTKTHTCTVLQERLSAPSDTGRTKPRPLCDRRTRCAFTTCTVQYSRYCMYCSSHAAPTGCACPLGSSMR